MVLGVTRQLSAGGAGAAEGGTLTSSTAAGLGVRRRREVAEMPTFV